ncbi:MAG TPA: hypothetical protein VFD59_16790 [Nocardioidaceae bacterium]|nr:hypothetical protein [Nocardioidaceae bacterium]
MTLAVVRSPRRAVGTPDLRVDLAPRRREFGNVRRPGRPEEKIDQVLVRPSGIHVVVHGSNGTADIAVDACLESAAAVGGLLPARYRGRVRPVLQCHHNEPVATLVRGVTVVTSTTTLEHIVRALPGVLSTSEVSEIAARLDARLEAAPAQAAQRRSRWGWRAVVAAFRPGQPGGGPEPLCCR